MENNVHDGSWVRQYKGVISLVGVVLALFLVAEAIKVFKSIPYVGRDISATNTIMVSGKGEAYAAPDIATFSFTVQSESLVVSTAQDKVNKDISAILAFLKKNGVAEKDIKTTNYSVYPRYEYPRIQCFAYPCPPSGKQTLAGYVVTESISVKVRTLADAGKLVSGVGELGATEVSGLTFSVDKEDSVQREARQKAIEDAQTKAKELANDLGVHLVRIVNYSEGGNYPVYYGKTMALSMDGGTPAPREAELPPGENQFVSNVTITYEIR